MSNDIINLENNLRYLELKKKFFSMEVFSIEELDKEIEEYTNKYKDIHNNIDNNDLYTNEDLNNLSIKLKDLNEKKKVIMEIIDYERKPIVDEIIKVQERISELKDKHENDYNEEYLDTELISLNNKKNELKKKYDELYSNNILFTLSKRRYLEKKQFNLTEEIFNKKNRIKELKDKYSNDYNGEFLDTELNTLVREVSDLEESLSNVEKELEKYYVELRKMQEELNNKKELFNKLKNNHSNSSDIYLDTELSELLKEIRDLEDKINKFNNLTSSEYLDKEISKAKEKVEKAKVKEEEINKVEPINNINDNPGTEIIPVGKSKEEDNTSEIIDVYETSPISDIEKVETPVTNNEPLLLTGPVLEHDSKMSKKAIAALAGGAAIGFGLSFVIQPGTAGLVISVGRLAYAAGKKTINTYTEKHKYEDTKIMSVINTIGDKANTFKESFKNNHPNITSGIRKVNNFLKKQETQMFINGLAAGYTVGKLTQMVNGLVNTAEATKTPVQDNIQDNLIADNTVDNIPKELVSGNKYDLSSITSGYTSSGGGGYTTLDTTRGVDAVFDRFVTDSNGQKWAHFFQKNGAGYAWFKAEDVERLINAVNTGGRGI